MIEEIKLGRKSIFIDIQSKCICRDPTPSNMKKYGADNSLYFGIFGKSPVEEKLKKIFNTNDLKLINQSIFKFDCYGQIAEVQFNINKEGQLQLKFVGRNLSQCFSDFQFEEGVETNWDKYFLVLDFENKKLRFKEKKDLLLSCN